jgi:hypothetical protein
MRPMNDSAAYDCACATSPRWRTLCIARDNIPRAEIWLCAESPCALRGTFDRPRKSGNIPDLSAWPFPQRSLRALLLRFLRSRPSPENYFLLHCRRDQCFPSPLALVPRRSHYQARPDLSSGLPFLRRKICLMSIFILQKPGFKCPARLRAVKNPFSFCQLNSSAAPAPAWPGRQQLWPASSTRSAIPAAPA